MGKILLIIVIVVVLCALWMRIGLMIVIPFLGRQDAKHGLSAPDIDFGTYMLALLWPMIVVMFMFLPWAAKPLLPKKYR